MKPVVLLVHESATVRCLLTMRLTIAGFEVVAVDDAAQALRAVRTFQPECIMIDLTAPIGGGAQLARILAARWTSPSALYVITEDGEVDDFNLFRARPLSRGQFFHPDFGTALRERFVDASELRSSFGAPTEALAL